ncbi:MAG: VOC family protein [Actinomycetota bacterium]|nr:VOC family protein [Actinomycetota bacterium]
MKLEHLDHVAITVSDLDRSMQWYRDVLGLERRFQDAWGDEPPIMMCAGDTCVALFPPSGRPNPVPGADTLAMRHFAFVTNRARWNQARAELKERGIEASFSDHGVSQSVYLMDPDGHTIELTTYELSDGD